MKQSEAADKRGVLCQCFLCPLLYCSTTAAPLPLHWRYSFLLPLRCDIRRLGLGQVFSSPFSLNCPSEQKSGSTFARAARGTHEMQVRFFSPSLSLSLSLSTALSCLLVRRHRRRRSCSDRELSGRTVEPFSFPSPQPSLTLRSH